ncbi:MAG: hypothetical protein H3C51_10645 [Rubellimicrobium sp.]|nr:hypothetical protein [Rubellimicrobium sp.]
MQGNGLPRLRPARAILFGVVLALAGAQVQANQTIIIGDDRGGGLNTRARLVEQMRAAHVRVEIRGSICYSACTMYLGAGDVCISPQTTFGFHGPTRDGRPMSADDAERWSRVMARYYPDGLRQWFLTTARFETRSIYRISGADMLRYGYPAC